MYAWVFQAVSSLQVFRPKFCVYFPSFMRATCRASPDCTVVTNWFSFCMRLLFAPIKQCVSLVRFHFLWRMLAGRPAATVRTTSVPFVSLTSLKETIKGTCRRSSWFNQLDVPLPLRLRQIRTASLCHNSRFLIACSVHKGLCRVSFTLTDFNTFSDLNNKLLLSFWPVTGPANTRTPGN
jgi:hypothetical protein